MSKYDGIPGNYTYENTNLGHSAYGVIQNGATSSRNGYAQRTVGGEYRQPDDQGSHGIANQFGGLNNKTNLQALNRDINQIDMKHVENDIAKLANNSNNTNTVHYQYQDYTPNSFRPDAVMINAGVRNNETGKTDEIHVSFQNNSHKDQEKWNDDIANLDAKNADIWPSQYAGMTPEQIALANEYAGKEDNVSDRLGEGVTYTFDQNGNIISSDIENSIDIVNQILNDQLSDEENIAMPDDNNDNISDENKIDMPDDNNDTPSDEDKVDMPEYDNNESDNDDSNSDGPSDGYGY